MRLGEAILEAIQPHNDSAPAYTSQTHRGGLQKLALVALVGRRVGHARNKKPKVGD
jgi:hypothetical protein